MSSHASDTRCCSWKRRRRKASTPLCRSREPTTACLWRDAWTPKSMKRFATSSWIGWINLRSSKLLEPYAHARACLSHSSHTHPHAYRYSSLYIRYTCANTPSLYLIPIIFVLAFFYYYYYYSSSLTSHTTAQIVKHCYILHRWFIITIIFIKLIWLWIWWRVMICSDSTRERISLSVDVV